MQNPSTPLKINRNTQFTFEDFQKENQLQNQELNLPVNFCSLSIQDAQESDLSKLATQLTNAFAHAAPNTNCLEISQFLPPDPGFISRQQNIDALLSGNSNINISPTLSNQDFEQRKSKAFQETISLIATGQINETALKNITFKLLFWIDCFFLKLYSSARDKATLPKVIVSCKITKHQGFFLILLHKMGSDILLLQNQEQASSVCKEMASFCIIKTSMKQDIQAFIGKHTQINHIGNNGKLNVSKPGRNTEKSNLNLVRQRNKPPKQAAKQQPHQVQPPQPVYQPQPASQIRPPQPRYQAQQPSTQAKQDLSYEEIARQSESVVMIRVVGYGKDEEYVGSGIAISKCGYILTNFHVIEGGKYFEIRFENDNNVYKTDKVIKYHSIFDLALLKIERGCAPLTIVKEANYIRGQKVVAIGSPAGLFNSVSDGIIASFRDFNGHKLIQYTAPVSGGSSGGPVLNMQGEVIGLCSWGMINGQNLNFAVPSDVIYDFVSNFLNY